MRHWLQNGRWKWLAVCVLALACALVAQRMPLHDDAFATKPSDVVTTANQQPTEGLPSQGEEQDGRAVGGTNGRASEQQEGSSRSGEGSGEGRGEATSATPTTEVDSANRTTAGDLPATSQPTVAKGEAQAKEQGRESAAEPSVEASPSMRASGQPSQEVAAYDGHADADLVAAVRTEVPHVDPVTIPAGRHYEPGVVLVFVAEDMSEQQLVDQLSNKELQSVDPLSATRIIDGAYRLSVAPAFSVEQAINDLLASGVVEGAEPNYNDFVVADEQSPDEATEDVAESAESTARPSKKPEEGNVRALDDANAADDAGRTYDGSDAGEGIERQAPEAEATANDDAQSHDQDGQEGVQAQAESHVTSSDVGGATAQSTLSDTYLDYQWALDSMDVFDAWDALGLHGDAPATPVGVAVIDTGFQATHVELMERVAATYNSNDPNASLTYLGSNHGTHVAGIVGATSNNGHGIAGVANNAAQLVLIRTTSDEGTATYESMLRALAYVKEHAAEYNIRVVNLSMGAVWNGVVNYSNTNGQALKLIDDLYEQGIVVVGSAGNSASDRPVPYTNWPSDYATVLSVMNLTADFSTVTNGYSNISGLQLYAHGAPKNVQLWNTSNYNAPGETTKDISAPGARILSLFYNANSDDFYGYLNGTSMAAPQVSGILSLMFTASSALTAAQACDTLCLSAVDLIAYGGAPGWDERYGYGEANAKNAVDVVQNGVVRGPSFLAVEGQGDYTIMGNADGAVAHDAALFSSDTSVLTVDEQGHATALHCGIAHVQASVQGATTGTKVTVVGPMEGDTLVAVDGSTQLSVAYPQEAGALGWDWSSSDASIASITNAGVVYGHKGGDVTITATLTADSSVSFTYHMHVYDPQVGVRYVAVGSSAALPTPSTGGTVTSTVWESRDETVATVDADGVAHGVAPGTAVVVCTQEHDGGSMSVSVGVVRVYGPIAGDVLLVPDASATLSIQNLPTELGSGWTWASSNGAVATVDNNGMVEGVAAGRATITATHGTGDTATSITHEVVVAGPLQGADTLEVGSTGAYSPMGPSDCAWTWTCSDESVLVVDQTGAARAVGIGTATITATLSGNDQAMLSKEVRVTGDLAKANVSVPSAAFTGTALVPQPQVTLGTSTLVQDRDYEVACDEVIYPGEYTVRLTGKGNCAGTSTTATFVVTPKKTNAPAGASLVYTGVTQSIAPGQGFDLSGTVSAKDVGTYSATAKLKRGYVWSDGTSANKTVSWTIAKAKLTATYAGDTMYAGETPSKQVTVTGFVGGESARTAQGFSSPTVSIPASYVRMAGRYSVTPTGGAAKNYTFVYHPGTLVVKAIPAAHVAYRTHVQTYGWQGWRSDGAISGTSGQSKRLEGIEIRLEGAPVAGGVEYRTHVQTYGWQAYRADGAMSGTSGEAKRLEAIQIRLTGQMAELYDVWYRVHAQTYGWLGWARNDAQAGTAGLARRLEGIEVRVLPKGSAAPGGTDRPFVTPEASPAGPHVAYRTHVQTFGWQAFVRDGAMSGTSGQAKRLEGIEIRLEGAPYSGSIEYRTHVQTYGWQGWRADGAMSGTSGEAKRLEAIQVRLTGQMADKYDVWYRVHAQTFGWMGWAANGDQAGTAGYAKRLEGIEVRVLPKDAAAPGTTANAFRER